MRAHTLTSPHVHQLIENYCTFECEEQCQEQSDVTALSNNLAKTKLIREQSLEDTQAFPTELIAFFPKK